MLPALRNYLEIRNEHNHELFKINFNRWLKEIIELLKSTEKLFDLKLYINPSNIFESLYRIASKQNQELFGSSEGDTIELIHEKYLKKSRIFKVEIKKLKSVYSETLTKLNKIIIEKKKCETELLKCRKELTVKKEKEHEYKITLLSFEQKNEFYEKEIKNLQYQLDRDKYFYLFGLTNKIPEVSSFPVSEELSRKREKVETQSELLKKYKDEVDQRTDNSKTDLRDPTSSRNVNFAAQAMRIEDHKDFSLSNVIPPSNKETCEKCLECHSLISDYHRKEIGLEHSYRQQATELESLRHSYRQQETELSENRKSVFALTKRLGESEEAKRVLKKDNEYLKDLFRTKSLTAQREMNNALFSLRTAYEEKYQQYVRFMNEKLTEMEQKYADEKSKHVETGEISEEDLNKYIMKMFEKYINQSKLLIIEVRSREIYAHDKDFERYLFNYERAIKTFETDLIETPMDIINEQDIEDIEVFDEMDKPDVEKGKLARDLSMLNNYLEELRKEVNEIREENRHYKSINIKIQEKLGIHDIKNLGTQLDQIITIPLHSGYFLEIMGFVATKIPDQETLRTLKDHIRHLSSFGENENVTDLQILFKNAKDIFDLLNFYGGSKFCEFLRKEQSYGMWPENIWKILSGMQQIRDANNNNLQVVFNLMMYIFENLSESAHKNEINILLERVVLGYLQEKSDAEGSNIQITDINDVVFTYHKSFKKSRIN